MAQILAGLPGSVNMMGDILVYGRDQAEHSNSNLERVLEQLVAAGVILSKSKCSSRVQTVTFWGCLISKHRISVDTWKVDAIKNLSAPEDVAGV